MVMVERAMDGNLPGHSPTLRDHRVAAARELARQGLTVSAIGDRMHLSTSTVERYLDIDEGSSREALAQEA
jgi:predicted transcriptional regulator